MLDFSSLEWSATRHRGISLRVLRRDEATGTTSVPIRMQPRSVYPAHRHTGVEEVFILQGGYRDDEGEHRAGDYVLREAGSVHCPVALDEGEDCIMLAVAHGGVELIR